MINNRLRRPRQSQNVRDLLAETSVSINNLIYPLFVNEDISTPRPVSSMPGVDQIPLALVADKVKQAEDLGIKSILLFGVTKQKDAIGSRSWHPEGVQIKMIEEARRASNEMVIISDNCFCEYTDHGHYGVIENNDLDNDRSLFNLQKQCVVSAQAGANWVAPSGMLDGMVQAIREALDQNNFKNTAILSYSTKFASNFYGPFRDAVESNFKGTRKSYQCDFRNDRQAIAESLIDEAEGADLLMVKPGIAYLDVISKIRARTLKPIVAYQVSGEYAMIKFAAQAGALNEDGIILETLTAFKRAGADLIISYFVPQVAKLLK